MKRTFELVAGVTCIIIGAILFFIASLCPLFLQAGMVGISGVVAFGFGIIKLHIYYEHNNK